MVKSHKPLFMLLALLIPAISLGQECQPYWTGLSRKFSGSMVVQDTDMGPGVFASGYPDPGNVNPVRQWNGREFVPVGSDLVGPSSGLYSLDSGTGRTLHFRSTSAGVISMRRWTGSVWEPLPPGMHISSSPAFGTNIEPRYTATGSGVAGLYGFMFDAEAPSRNRVVRWTGSGWKMLGDTAASNGLNRIGEYFTGGKWNLLVSGGFFEFSGLDTRYLVRWDGNSWHAMGEVPGAALSMITWDDGNGASLYIGFIGSPWFPPLSHQGIARWTGTQWVSVGGGVLEPAAGNGRVDSMVVFDDGTGPALFVAGSFSRAGGASGIPARNIAKWDGQQWHNLGSGVSGFPDTLVVADDGRGPSLFVNGHLTAAGGGVVSHIAQYVGCAGNRQCYPDCDNNRHLNANDFMCFLNKFAARDPYANCDVSTVTPAINAADFSCFLNKYAAGCP